jgi:DNA-binding IclR family transcriptional regulator
VARTVGDYPIRTLTLDRGDRRPLGVGAGALALYGAMPASTRAAVSAHQRGLACRIRIRATRNWSAEGGSRPRGYAWNERRRGGRDECRRLAGGDAIGRLVAALAVGAINERMEEGAAGAGGPAGVAGRGGAADRHD